MEDHADYFDTLANHVHLTLQNHQPHRDDFNPDRKNIRTVV
jgi:hypothetical protein